MKFNKNGLAIIVLIGVMSISACTQSYSQAPAATPTLIATGLFVSPFPSVENPMAMIEEFAKGTATAAVLTSVAGGGPVGTPGTLGASAIGTPLTPGVTTPITTGTPGTPTNANAGAITPIVVTASGANSTPVPVGSRPATYTLQKGEFPYCIARRYNVNPNELLSLNGITDGSLYMPGFTLKIPQSGNPFPGSRALHNHPDTYTVSTSDTTVYGVACYYGDLEPAAIAQASGISASTDLTAGQKLTIP